MLKCSLDTVFKPPGSQGYPPRSPYHSASSVVEQVFDHGPELIQFENMRSDQTGGTCSFHNRKCRL
jgi:hypothetical protein